MTYISYHEESLECENEYLSLGDGIVSLSKVLVVSISNEGSFDPSQVKDCKSGFLFPAGDDQALGKVLLMVKSNTLLAQSVALEGASVARSLFARDAVVQYCYLLEKVLDFPGEAQLPRPTVEIQEVVPPGWRWDFLGDPGTASDNSTVKDLVYLTSATDLRFVANVSGHDSGVEDMETVVDDFDLLNENDLALDKKGEKINTLEQAEDEMVFD